MPNALPPSPNDDLPFHHYTLKHRVIAWISKTLFDNVSYTVHNGLLQGMKRKGGLGWVPAFAVSGGQTKEHLFWRNLDLRGKVVYDIGAFHGLLSLYFSRMARQVIAYEPNRRNQRRLAENLALNRIANVRVRPVGIGSAPQVATMVSMPLMPGGASIEQNTKEQLLRSHQDAVTEEIELTTLDLEITSGMPVPDFVKIDIEGWELEALRGAREMLTAHRPALFLEMHGETLNEKRRKVTEIVSYLWNLGYTNIRHVETDTAIAPENALVAVEGHLYCPSRDGTLN
jgi:FkbM family methyltransferase